MVLGFGAMEVLIFLKVDRWMPSEPELDGKLVNDSARKLWTLSRGAALGIVAIALRARVSASSRKYRNSIRAH